MNILFELLNELKYQAKESFTYDIPSVENKSSVVVFPFVSVEYPCQTYLVIEIDNKALSKVDNEYLKTLALAFRKTQFHESDMDKNSTLVIASIRPDTEPINSEAKVKIEDDPYYFKKYVFSYTSASERLAIEYLAHKKSELKSEFSYVNEILDYLMNAEQFGSYKKLNDEPSTYNFFIELATKVPAFPLNVKNAEHIKSVDQFLVEYLNGEEICIDIMDRLVFSDINFKDDSVETILAKYDALISN